MKRFSKRAYVIAAIIAVLCSIIAIAYTVSRLFYIRAVESSFSKKTIFQIELSTSELQGEVGLGDTVWVNPAIENTATEAMYVFIEIDTAECNGLPLYEYDIDDCWLNVESSGGNTVYAYADSDGMIAKLYPGETTVPLLSSMTMRNITIAEYAEIEDINIRITGYAIDTNGYSMLPSEVWYECKTLR